MGGQPHLHVAGAAFRQFVGDYIRGNKLINWRLDIRDWMDTKTKDRSSPPSDSISVGIASVGMYLPETVLTATDIAEQSGLPEWVVREKLGINQKHIAGPDDHPNEMAIKAAQDCLSKTDIPPKEIDVVLCTTEEWREYLLWTSGIHLAYEIGATRAWGIDIHTRCCTTVAALKMAKDMMIADPDINKVLIGGGYRIGDFINFRTLDTTLLFNIGAGAGALLLRKNWPRNHVLGARIITDGSMSKHPRKAGRVQQSLSRPPSQ